MTEEANSSGSNLEEIIGRFSQYNDWEDRYRELVKMGRALPELEEKFKAEKYKIKGCQSQVWLVPELRAGKLYFSADSDAMLVKGIIALLVEAYSGLNPEEVLERRPDFLKEIGITEHLSMNRTNGLANMVKQIHMYGIAFKSLTEKGVMDVPSA